MKKREECHYDLLAKYNELKARINKPDNNRAVEATSDGDTSPSPYVVMLVDAHSHRVSLRKVHVHSPAAC